LRVRIAVGAAPVFVVELGDRGLLDGPPDDQEQRHERDLEHHGDPEDGPKTSHR
jgi:hypothetical protein